MAQIVDDDQEFPLDSRRSQTERRDERLGFLVANRFVLECLDIDNDVNTLRLRFSPRLDRSPRSSIGKRSRTKCSADPRLDGDRSMRKSRSCQPRV